MTPRRPDDHAPYGRPDPREEPYRLAPLVAERVTARTLSRMLKITVNSVYRLVRSGRIRPDIHDPRTRRLLWSRGEAARLVRQRAELLRWLADHPPDIPT